MPKAAYWPEKPNDTVYETGGRVYTHRDCRGNPTRLLNSDLLDSRGGNYSKVWARLSACRLEEQLVITTHDNSLSPYDSTPEFVKGAVNQREYPAERWAHVKVDTPMGVSTGREADVFVSLFSHAEGDTVYTFEVGESSTDNNGRLATWEYVTVAPTECNP
jgi:hypothetical protein